MKIGMLIPEFPGQTHIFYWRELHALRGLGVSPQLISTTEPPVGIRSHEWTESARAETVYLAPSSKGDIPAVLADALRELLRAGGAGVSRALASFARAEGIPPARRPRLLGLLAMGARLKRVAAERGLDHVHVHSCADAAHVAMFCRLLGGPTYSITLHSSLRDYGPNQREKWRHAKFAMVITQRLLKEIQEPLAGALPATVEVVPMGVDVANFRRTHPYEPYVRGGKLRLFSCGRLNPCKGHLYLIQSVAKLRERGVDVELAIAGEDEQGGSGYHLELAKEIEKMDLGARVSLLGAVSEARVRAELERAQVFVLASLAEPLGVAIMEAMAYGTPVVATSSGGVPELVRQGKDGLLVPPENADAIADAVIRLAEDAALPAILTSARERVESMFDSSRSAEVLARLARA